MLNVLKIAGWALVAVGVIAGVLNFISNLSDTGGNVGISLVGAVLEFFLFAIVGGVLLLAADSIEKGRRKREL